MIIFAKGALFSYEVWVFNKILPEVDLPFPIKAMKRTLNEIKHIFFLKVYYRQSTIGKYKFIIWSIYIFIYYLLIINLKFKVLKI